MSGRAARARPRPSPRVDWKRLRAEAQRRFHIEDFRPGQRELIECVLSGHDALGILPTGAGKSLCYQLPALFIDGAALVISFLIALMQDQHEHMKAAAISSLRLDSSVSISARQQGEATLIQGQHEVVLMTAERLQKTRTPETAQAPPHQPGGD